MEPIIKTKLSDMVSEKLIEYILEHNLQPGHKLPTEHELTSTLNIGRTSVREGLRQLEAAGLITTRQGYGVILNEVTLDTLLPSERKIPIADFLVLSPKELGDLMDLRLLIEVAACNLINLPLPPQRLAALQTCCRHMTAHSKKPEKFIQPDIQFHQLLAEFSGNSLYPRIFSLISELFWKQQASTAMLPGALERALQYHENICQALIDNDVASASEILADHLMDTKNNLTQYAG